MNVSDRILELAVRLDQAANGSSADPGQWLRNLIHWFRTDLFKPLAILAVFFVLGVAFFAHDRLTRAFSGVLGVVILFVIGIKTGIIFDAGLFIANKMSG
jgi:type IV secretory pathway VirB2 component (pilin)